MDVLAVTLTVTPSYMQRLWEALAKQEGYVPTYRGVMVNNCHNADLAGEALRHSWMTLDLGRNTSFSEGNNAAVEAARKGGLLPDYVLLLNDDLIPRPDFLAKLWAQRSRAEVLGAIMLHDDGTVNHAGTAVWPDCASDHLGRGEPAESWVRDGVTVLTPSATFAAVLVHAQVWQQLGGLDESYWHGWEDTDFCLRALEAGYRVGVARGAVAVHGECGTRPRNGPRDVKNFQVFHARWSAKLGGLLDAYGRKHPAAQGLNWRR